MITVTGENRVLQEYIAQRTDFAWKIWKAFPEEMTLKLKLEGLVEISQKNKRRVFQAEETACAKALKQEAGGTVHTYILKAGTDGAQWTIDQWVQDESVMSQGHKSSCHRSHIKDVCLSPKGSKIELKGIQLKRDVNSSHLHKIKIRFLISYNIELHSTFGGHKIVTTMKSTHCVCCVLAAIVKCFLSAVLWDACCCYSHVTGEIA